MARPDSQSDEPRPAACRLDPPGFAERFRACYPSLRVVAAAQAGRSEADDVVQQAAIVALERLDRFEAGTDFRAWMAAIVRGVARNHRRSKTRRDRKHRALSDRSPRVGAAEARAEEPVPRVLRDARGVEVTFPEGFDAKLRNAVDALGPLQAACLLLKTVHGHTYDEISEMLDVPPATARSHVFRARTSLLDSMSPEDTDV